MGTPLARIFNDSSADVRGKIIGMYVVLFAFNIGVWIWAFITFRSYPLQLGTCVLAYSFGLRHAVDADHIAAIDNVTRKLMQQGKRPVAVGFFFSLGHSTIVILASAAVALTALAFNKSHFDYVSSIGGIIGTLVSGFFLLLIALMNIVILVSIYRKFQEVKAGRPYVEEDFDILLANRGFLARIFRPIFHLVNSSWQMYPVGFLFGLGFDTATEVGLLGLAAAGGAHGLPIWSIMVFPFLFTAGMSLIDSTDSILMLGAYGWAFVKPIRKLFYNMTITAASVVVALFVGGVETLGLIASQYNLSGGVWDWLNWINDDKVFGLLGISIIGVFIAAWIISYVIYRTQGYDNLEVAVRNNGTD